MRRPLLPHRALGRRRLVRSRRVVVLVGLVVVRQEPGQPGLARAQAAVPQQARHQVAPPVLVLVLVPPRLQRWLPPPQPRPSA